MAVARAHPHHGEPIAAIVYTLVKVFLPEVAASNKYLPLMIGIFAFLGQLGLRYRPVNERLDWSHGMVVVALTWLVVPAVGSIPFIFSGHYGSPVDAIFDAMSGLTTTGLSLVQDLDHMAPSLNFWRHLLHFLGGQGIVIAALVLFAGGGGLTLYYGEARDE